MAIRRINGSVMRNAVVDFRFSAVRRLLRLRVPVPGTLFERIATSAMMPLPHWILAVRPVDPDLQWEAGVTAGRLSCRCNSVAANARRNDHAIGVAKYDQLPQLSCA